MEIESWFPNTSRAFIGEFARRVSSGHVVLILYLQRCSGLASAFLKRLTAVLTLVLEVCTPDVAGQNEAAGMNSPHDTGTTRSYTVSLLKELSETGQSCGERSKRTEEKRRLLMIQYNKSPPRDATPYIYKSASSYYSVRVIQRRGAISKVREVSQVDEMLGLGK